MQEINDKDIQKPIIISEIPPKQHLSLLKKIFHVNPLYPNIFLPILISSDDIPRLFYYLKKKKIENESNKNEDNHNNNDSEALSFDNKLEIFTILMTLFKQNKNLVNLFTKRCKSNLTYFFEPIIDLYLSEELRVESDKEFLEQLIIYIINIVSIPKFLLEYIYQKLAVYLRYNSNNIPINKLSENIFKRYLNLLEIFYTNSLDHNINNLYNKNDDANENQVMENLITNYFDSEQQKEIKNYIYFNGYKSKMSILINPNSNNINCDFPTLEYGCSFVFWINLDKNIINDYYSINNGNNNNKTMKLISFILGGHQISLIIKNINNLLFIIDEIESSSINISESFKYGNWNNICLILYPKKIISPKVLVNGNNIDFSINIPKNYSISNSEKIDNITLFENLIGRISSAFFCGNVLNNDIISIFGKSQGFYKIKYLFKFLLSIDSNYYQFSHIYKYYEKFKNTSTNKNLSKININADEQNIKNIVGLFCPFSYDESKNQIDDVFGNFIGIISSENDGANNYINYSKNIEQIGEINNLLPIMELMLLSNNQNKLLSTINMNNNKIEIENLLTEKILLKYLHIIKKIINGKKHNIISANNTNFFSHLGLFLEKFPSKIFTKTILNIFYDIGKETFQYSDDKKKFSFTFVNMVLLNEKIFSKFSEENRLKLWDNMNKFFTSDYSQLKDSLNMSKICLLLRFYDKDRYIKYCCKKHANLFKICEDENNINIMNPDMNTKIGKLFDTIQLYVNKLSNESDTINLFKLLSLDLSPCLQKKIIMVYQYFFENHKIQEDVKEHALDNLLNNYFFEIFEYVLSVSLLDVRIELIELLRIISIEYKQKIENYIAENKLIIMDYIGEYLLPDNLKVNLIDKDIEKDNKMFYLNEYFDKESYNGDIVLLWNVLNNWITYKSIIPIEHGNGKKLVNYLFANPSVINIFIQFVSKVSPYYIDCLLILLFSLVTNITIYNRNVFLNNNSFYKWLFEIIYFFHNKNNEKLIEEKEKSIIELIKLHSIELFKNFLSYKKNSEENSEIINYILDYSYYLKNKNKNSEEQIKEITNITRLILSIIIDSSGWDIDILTKSCFEFMFLYKNNQVANNCKEKDNNVEEDKNENKKEDDKEDEKDKDNNNNISIIKKDKKSKNISKSVNVKEINEKKMQLNLEPDIFESIKEVEEEEVNDLKIEKTKTTHFDDIVNSIGPSDNNIEDDNILEERNSSFDDKINKKNNQNNNINIFLNSVLIPDFLYDNLYTKENKGNEEGNNFNSNILKETWEDCNLYDFIIDYYCSNIWGIENMCKNVKIDYEGKILEIFKVLLKEYGENKTYKNSLMKILDKYFNFKDIDNKLEKKESDKINIFILNLILLCIAFDTTGDLEEKNYIENKLEQFLIFCILCSVNITTSEKTHNNIQNKLYDLLGYGLLFLKKRDENKYSEFVEKVIMPIYEDIQNENQKKGIKGIFSSNKKTIYKHTALFKLFTSEDSEKDDDNNIGFRDSNKKIVSRTLRAGTVQNKLTFNSKGNINKKEPMFESLSGKNMNKVNPKKEKKKKKDKKKSNLKIIFDGDVQKIIKHIIDDTIKLFKIKRNNNKDTKNYIKEFYNKYKDTNNLHNITENKLIINENKKINEKLLDIIPFLETQIRKYSSTSLIQEKKRRNKYKKMKKILFSWRGFWSQRDLFYEFPEHLKLKIKNHFTKEMTKILFSPIIDLDYNMPTFSKFDNKKLFNKDDFKYKVNLNIENLLLSNENEESVEGNNKNMENPNSDNNTILKEEKKENKKISNKSLIIRNKYGFNYLESIYKLSYDGIWEQYKIYFEQKLNLDNTNNQINQNIINDRISDLKINKKDKNVSNKENKKKKNINSFRTTAFRCCLVKCTHHIHGYIICKKKKIKFKYSQEERKKKLTMAEIMADPSYDKDMDNCFGSTFKKNLKDKDKVDLKIYYKDIKFIFLRKYFYQNTAMEIYTINNKSYFFNFKSNFDFNKYINQLLYFIHFREIKTEDHKGKKLLGYEQMFGVTSDKKIKSYYISNKLEDWQNYKISTMEYLMWMNIYSGRSFNDLTQYPIFPWIISNYITDDLEDESNFRNLSIPIGMMEFNDKSIMRKETFIDTYDTVKNDLKESNHDFNYQEYLKKGDEYFYNYRNKKLKLSERNYSVQINPTNDPEFPPNSLNNLNNLNVNDNIALVEINQLPSYFGSHYSNPTYVCHYLTRVFPFSFISIEIQGEKFDDPNRIFHSMEKTFESCMTLKDDVRELIPEFYFLPEMLKNNNNLNLTQDLLDSNGEKIIINDVELPPWANNSAYTFISEMRNNLEKGKSKLNKWIDLIFGTYQKGEKAEEVHNIFQAQTYERMVKIEKIKDIDMRDAMMRLVEVGVTPCQILDKDSKGKIDKKEFLVKNKIYSYAEGIFLDESKKLNKFYLTSLKYKSLYTTKYENNKITYNKDYKEMIYPSIMAIKCINPKNLKIFINNNSWYNIKISNHDNKLHTEESNIYQYENNSSKYAPCHPISLNNIPIVIYHNEKYIIKGGFWDSRLEINSLQVETDKKEKDEQISKNIFIPNCGPIIILKMTSNEKLLFCGTKYGNIIIFNVNGPILEKSKILYNHSGSITSISLNENLNMFASSSIDGYIHLYTLPSFTMVRSIQISQKVKYDIKDYDYEESKKNEYLYADNIFLSSSPLPCFTIYILSKKIFKTYSINGEFILQVEEDNDTGKIKCPLIFQNLQFHDYLIYGTEDGYVKIRSFPDMNLISSIRPFEGQEIKALELSPDKRFCYVWSHKDKIAIIEDANTHTGFEMKDNFEEKEKEQEEVENEKNNNEE